MNKIIIIVHCVENQGLGGRNSVNASGGYLFFLNFHYFYPSFTYSLQLILGIFTYLFFCKIVTIVFYNNIVIIPNSLA